MGLAKTPEPTVTLQPSSEAMPIERVTFVTEQPSPAATTPQLVTPRQPVANEGEAVNGEGEEGEVGEEGEGATVDEVEDPFAFAAIPSDVVRPVEEVTFIGRSFDARLPQIQARRRQTINAKLKHLGTKNKHREEVYNKNQELAVERLKTIEASIKEKDKRWLDPIDRAEGEEYVQLRADTWSVVVAHVLLTAEVIGTLRETLATRRLQALFTPLVYRWKRRRDRIARNALHRWANRTHRPTAQYIQDNLSPLAHWPVLNLDRLARRMSPKMLYEGDVLCYEGEPALSMFFLEEGRLSIRQRTTRKNVRAGRRREPLREIGEVKEGSVYGDDILFKPTATVHFATLVCGSKAVRVWELARHDYLAEMLLLPAGKRVALGGGGGDPGGGSFCDSMTGEDNVASYPLTCQQVRENKCFHNWTDDAILPMLKQSEVLSFAKDEAIFNVGDYSDGLYLVWRGTVEILVRFDGSQDIRRTYVNAGMCFGEEGALFSVPRHESATAATDCRVHKVSIMEVINGMMTHPAYLSDLKKDLNRQRSLRLQRPPTHEVAKYVAPNLTNFVQRSITPQCLSRGAAVPINQYIVLLMRGTITCDGNTYEAPCIITHRDALALPGGTGVHLPTKAITRVDVWTIEVAEIAHRLSKSSLKFSDVLAPAVALSFKANEAAFMHSQSM